MSYAISITNYVITITKVRQVDGINTWHKHKGNYKIQNVVIEIVNSPVLVKIVRILIGIVNVFGRHFEWNFADTSSTVTLHKSKFLMRIDFNLFFDKPHNSTGSKDRQQRQHQQITDEQKQWRLWGGELCFVLLLL